MVKGIVKDRLRVGGGMTEEEFDALKGISRESCRLAYQKEMVVSPLMRSPQSRASQQASLRGWQLLHQRIALLP